MKPLFSLLALILVFSLTSCNENKEKFKQQLMEIIKDDPAVIVTAIKEHPQEIIDALQFAAREAQMAMMKKREDEMKGELEKSYSNPLTPEISDSTIIRGNRNAPITLVEYSDFECPYCLRGFDTVSELMKKYGDKIRFVYKHLPLNIHQNAEVAARYFEAIGKQSHDKAWQFHDTVLKNQKTLSSKGVKFLDEEAKKLSLNMQTLKKDLESDDVKKRVESDMAEAEKLGFQGTPGFIINGIPVRGALPANYFDQIIEELKKRGKLTL